jgi:hypothetical protein
MQIPHFVRDDKWRQGTRRDPSLLRSLGMTTNGERAARFVPGGGRQIAGTVINDGYFHGGYFHDSSLWAVAGMG